MNIMTESGISIYCLPECARCRVTGRNPELMDVCPNRKYDAFGDICIPDDCIEYEEQM